MSILFRQTGPTGRRELEAAVAEYLELSRSALRRSEPGWFALAEEAAWERLRLAAGLPRGGGSEGVDGPAGDRSAPGAGRAR